MSTSTRCRTVQLLEPDAQPPYEVTEVDENSLAVDEGGALYLTEGSLTTNVLFTTEKLDAEYDIYEHDISNDVDVDPMEIDYNFTNRTAEGFTLVLDSAPDSGNYRFRYRVRVNELEA